MQKSVIESDTETVASKVVNGKMKLYTDDKEETRERESIITFSS